MNKKGVLSIQPISDWGNEERSLPTLKVCPELGLKDDRETITAFPSTDNYCYQGKKPAGIELDHQEKFCLTMGYPQCPIYRQARQEEPTKPPMSQSKIVTWSLIALLSTGLVTGVLLVLNVFP
jgi:hypothetical protein